VRQGKAVEGHRIPRRWRFRGTLGWRAASWNAPALGRFEGQDARDGQRKRKSGNWGGPGAYASLWSVYIYLYFYHLLDFVKRI